MKPLIVLVALLGLGLGFSMALWLNPSASTSNSKLSENFIDFTLTDIEGNTHTLSQWQDNIIVLNFWATWCPPCRKEIPSFIKLQTQYKDRKVQFVGLAVDTAENVRQFQAQYKINYPLLLGDNILKISYDYGNLSGSLPYTVMINRKQQIIFSHLGELSEMELKTQIENLL